MIRKYVIKEQDDKIPYEKIINFLKDTEIKSDEDVHAFAESIGLDPHVLELEIYKIIQTFFRGGKSFDSKLDARNIQPDEFQKGLGIESEHVDENSPYAIYFEEKITSDHLIEDKIYNTHLLEMEDKYSKKGE
jgi:hypothetical protein